MKKIVSNTNRDYSIDCLKGILIFMVIFGHSICSFSGLENKSLDLPIQRFIYLVHMPLFMFLSGLVSRKFIENEGFVSGCIKKIKQLILPMLFWCSLIFALKWSMGMITVDSPISLIKRLYVSCESGYWFIWSLFWCSIYTKIVVQLLGYKNWLWLIIGCLFFFLFPHNDKIAVFHLDETKFMLPFYISGYFLSTQNWHNIADKIGCFVMCLILYFLCCLDVRHDWFCYSLDFNVFNNSNILYNYLHLLFLIIAGFTGIYLFLFISRKISLDNLFIRPLVVLGQQTLGIYMIQGILYNVLLVKFSIVFYSYVGWFVVSVLITLICFFLVDIAKKSKILKYLV